MSTKYEFMTDDEIVNQYKIIKQKERLRNKEAYERLKLNSVKYRQRLTIAHNNQVERMNKIKQNEEIYNNWLANNKIIQSKAYYKKVETKANIKMMILNLSDNED